MNASLSKLVLILGIWVPAALSLSAEQGIPSPSIIVPSQGIPSEPEPIHQWLDEVRAQRKIREERRRAQKEAIDARRRWINPWGAAQHEAREKESQRRREAFLEKIERERETFRNRSPWRSAQPHWQEPPPGNALAHPEAHPDSEGRDSANDAPAPLSPYPPLQGWDNRWYYRGY